jgi:hypothetical protein
MKKMLVLNVAMVLAGSALNAGIISISANNTVTGNRATNLVANGSFETGAIGNQCISGSAHDGGCPGGPLGVIPNWTFTGDSGSYGWWGPLGFAGAPPADGSNYVYFGNSFATPNETPAFGSNGVVTWPNASTLGFSFSSNISHPTTLFQTINGLTPGNTYALDFFTSGEVNNGAFSNAGVFGLQISGENLIYLTTPSTGSQFGSTSIRYHVTLTANASSETFTWENWGHICSSCTELVVDDVILNAAAVATPEPATCVLIGVSLAGLVGLRRIKK